MAEHGGSLVFGFSRALVVGFRRGLLLRDHSGEGKLIRLTLIGGGRQRSPATVRRLGWSLVTVRVASGEALAPRTCTEASSNSPLAARPINCSERQRKIRIWWLPRVRRVFDLRLKIRTMGGAIYRVLDKNIVGKDSNTFLV
jgi:hypothetical protein